MPLASHAPLRGSNVNWCLDLRFHKDGSVFTHFKMIYSFGNLLCKRRWLGVSQPQGGTSGWKNSLDFKFQRDLVLGND